MSKPIIRESLMNTIENLTVSNEELRQALKKSILLARRTAWIAYVWNDHNFGPAHVMAREECEAHGIRSFSEANVFLESSDKLLGEG